MRSGILLVYGIMLLSQAALGQSALLQRTLYGFRLSATGNGELFWTKGGIDTDAARMVAKDGYIFSAYSGSGLFIAGDWRNIHFWKNGVRESDGSITELSPAHAMYWTTEEWTGLSAAERDSTGARMLRWPAAHGAPFMDGNGDGRYAPDPGALPEYEPDSPVIIGHEALWTATQDASAEAQREYGIGKTGLQFHHLVWSYAGEGCPERVIFHRLRVINTMGRPFEHARFAFAAEVSLGDSDDDLVGTDSLLGITYYYNAGDSDALAGNPAAGGYLLLQGPWVEDANEVGLFDLSLRRGIRNLPLSASTFFTEADSMFSPPDSASRDFPIQLRNAIDGLRTNGEPQVDPVSGQPVRMAVQGDPVLQSGWRDGIATAPGKRMMLFSTGPFFFAPGDTQEVILARIGAQGETRVEDVIALRDYALCVRQHFMGQFITTVATTPSPANFHIDAVWPQPFMHSAQGKLQLALTLDAPGSITLHVTDILGRSVSKKTTERLPAGSHTLPLSLPTTLSPGVYILRCSSAGQQSLRTLQLR
jgi:hypothetical protein